MNQSYHDVLFFDIDGTLISDKTGKVPQSAIHAIKDAGQRGCLTFINTGRTCFFVPNLLKELSFDGFLCGCGTHIISHGKTLYHYTIPHHESLEIIEKLQACNIEGVLEGETFNYFSRNDSRFPQINQIRDSFIGNVDGRARFFDDPDIRADKFVIWADEQSVTEPFFSFIKSKNYDIIDRRFGFYEIVPKGHSKATAIEYILDRFHLTKEHAYVFGDSANDLPMFTCVKNTIAMGEYDPVLKPYTSFVTKTVEEDGIAYALEKLGFLS